MMKWLLIISVLIVLVLSVSSVGSEAAFYSPPPPTATVGPIPTSAPVAEVFIPLVY